MLESVWGGLGYSHPTALRVCHDLHDTQMVSLGGGGAARKTWEGHFCPEYI